MRRNYGICNRPTLRRFVALIWIIPFAVGHAAHGQDSTGNAVVAAHVPLRIAVTKRVKLKRGALVSGTLLEPVYVGATLALAAGSHVSGKVIETPPVARDVRVNALLNADFTPLHQPVVNFNAVQLSSGATLQMDTLARVRQADMVRFVPKKKQSVFGRLKGMVGERVHSNEQQFTAPHKSDRLLRLLYNQLPYHPQRIWANTEFDAELQAPLTLAVPQPETVTAAPADTLLHLQPTVQARLVDGISSDTAKNGEEVHAVLTVPVWDAEHRLIAPEGASLNGVVLHVKASRSFGRNGVLRFGFRSMQPVAGPEAVVQGQVTGAEGEKSADVTVDDEGGVHAEPDKDRFIAPLVLAVLAAGGHDDDGGSAQQGLASNGLGLIVRVVGFTAGSRNFAFGVGLYGLGKSIYRHFLAHGKPVAFPRDTEVEVQLSARQ